MSIKSAERMLDEISKIKVQVLLLEAGLLSLHDVLNHEAVVPFSVGREAMVKYEDARVEVLYRTHNLLQVEAIIDPSDDALRYMEETDDEDEDALDARN